MKHLCITNSVQILHRLISNSVVYITSPVNTCGLASAKACPLVAISRLAVLEENIDRSTSVLASASTSSQIIPSLTLKPSSTLETQHNPEQHSNSPTTPHLSSSLPHTPAETGLVSAEFGIAEATTAQNSTADNIVEVWKRMIVEL